MSTEFSSTSGQPELRVVGASAASPEDFESFRSCLLGVVREKRAPTELDATFPFTKQDLPTLIDIVHDVEGFCCAQAEARIRSHRYESTVGTNKWWRGARKSIVMDADATWWNWRILWLREIRTRWTGELNYLQAKDQPVDHRHLEEGVRDSVRKSLERHSDLIEFLLCVLLMLALAAAVIYVEAWAMGVG